MGLYLWLEEVWSKFLAATVNDFLNNINWFFFLFNVLQDHAPTQRILGSGYSVTGVGDEPLLNMYKPWWLFTLQNTVEWYPVLFCHCLFCRHSRKTEFGGTFWNYGFTALTWCFWLSACNLVSLKQCLCSPLFLDFHRLHLCLFLAFVSGNQACTTWIPKWNCFCF